MISTKHSLFVHSS